MTTNVMAHTATLLVVDVPEAGQIVQIDMEKHPALQTATAAKIDNVQCDGSALRWPALNVEVALTDPAVRPFRFYI